MDRTDFIYQFSNDLSIFTSGDSSLEDEESDDEYRLPDTNSSSLGMFLESADTSAMEKPIAIGNNVGAENVNLIHNGMLKVDAKQTSKKSDHDIPKNIHTGAKKQNCLSDNEASEYGQELKALQEFLERYNKNRSSSNDEEVMKTNDYVSYMETNASSPNAVRSTFLFCLRTNDTHLADRLLRDIGIEYIIRHCLVYDGIFTTRKDADSVDGLSTQTSCTNMFWLCSFYGSADVLEILIEECWIFFVEKETGGAVEPCKEVQDRADNALALLLNNDVESYGCTPLFIAAAQDHAAVIKVLLKHKVDPNTANEVGTTAASVAASRDNLSVLEALGEAKDADVDFNQANKDGITPLLAACQYGSVECVRYLTHYMGHASSSTGQPIVNCRVQDSYGLGCTALAAKHDNHEVVTYFCQINNPSIEFGVNINQVTRDENNTALHVAAQHNSKEAAKSLLQMIPREIDPLRRNKRGMTALHIAASRGHAEIVKEFVTSLRDGMKDLDTADSVGMTPLFYGEECTLEWTVIFHWSQNVQHNTNNPIPQPNLDLFLLPTNSILERIQRNRHTARPYF